MRGLNALAGLSTAVLLTVGTTAFAADPDLRLVQAAADQDRQAVRALIKEGVDVNAARADGVTALIWAAHWNDLETITLLLGARANVNAADDHGVTALARACENANAAIVDRLLAAGANPNLAQESGLTPLMIAARTGSVAVGKALVARGAKVNAATAGAEATALMWAISGGHREFVRLLIEGGADVHRSTSKGFTPLLFAARSGDIEAAKLLIAAGVGVNETGTDRTHALPYAITNAQDAFALFLIEQGADPNGTIDGIPALHAAAGAVTTWLGDWARRHGVGGSLALGGGFSNLSYDRRFAVVKALLEKGANPNGRITTSAMFMGYIGYPKKGAFEPFATGTGDLTGATPLWVAAYTANQGGGGRGAGMQANGPTSSDVLRLLLSAGANPHLTTADGTTPLMVAAGMGRATFSPGPAARRPIPERGRSRDGPARRGRRHPRRERSRLHRAPRCGVPRPQRSDPDPGRPRGRHQRTRLQGPHAVPDRGRLQAVVPVPGVSRDRGVPEEARGQHETRRAGHRAGTRARSDHACAEARVGQQ